MYQFRAAQREDMPELLLIWERSVNATHDFLAKEDIYKLKAELKDYFPQVPITLVTEGTTILGFASVEDENLNMLFLDETAIGKGIGKKLFQYMLAHYPFDSLEVNRDNPRALAFYLGQGFEVVSESPVDDAGRPFPILKMKLLA